MSLERYVDETTHALRGLLPLRPQIDEALGLILRTLRNGNTLLICGNGGSAAEAQHFATELVGRYKGSRRSLPAIALSSDGTLLSCIANDFGWEAVFARQISGLARPGDLVVCLSSSGNSPNVVAALEEARRRGLFSIALLGRGGGAARARASCEIIVPGDRGASAQEAHLFLIHYFCESVESEFPSET